MNSPAASRRRARGFSGYSGANLQKSTNRHKLITPAQLPVAPQFKVAARDQNAPYRPISLPALPYRGQLNWTDELGSPSDGLITPHLMPGPRKLVLHRDPDPQVRSRRNPALAKSRRIGVQPTPNRAAFGQGGTATCLKALNSRTFSQDWSKYPTCALRTGRKKLMYIAPRTRFLRFYPHQEDRMYAGRRKEPKQTNESCAFAVRARKVRRTSWVF